MPLTAAEVILLATVGLPSEGRVEFSEWDLTVAAWKRDPVRFGCRGYEDSYPDHKRVMMEIMSSSKNNPVRRGLIEKVRPNHYRVTPLGLTEARKIAQPDASPIAPAPHDVYDAIVRYVEHPVFRRYLDDRDEPKSWPSAASFLDLNQMTAVELGDSLRAVTGAAEAARDWFRASDTESLRRGHGGGGRAILQAEVEMLPSRRNPREPLRATDGCVACSGLMRH